LVDRVLFSHPKFHEKNLKKIIKVLLDKCFPLPFIFSTINKKIKQLSYKENNSNKDNKLKQLDKTEFLTIPYVNSVSESFLPVCGKYGFNMSHSILNTLKRYIKRGKDDFEVFVSLGCCLQNNM